MLARRAGRYAFFMDASSMVRLYHLAYERAPEPILVLACDGRSLFTNRAARDLPASLLGAVVAHLDGAGSCVLRDEALFRGRAWTAVPTDAVRLALDCHLHGDQLVVQVRRPPGRCPRAAAGPSHCTCRQSP